MKVRIISAAVGIVLVISVLFVAEMFPIFIGIILGLVNAIMTGEYLSAKKLHRKYMISIPCIALSLVTPVLVYYMNLMVVMYAFALVMMISLIFYHDHLSYDDTAFAIVGTLVITCGMTSISAMCVGGQYTSFYVVICLCVPWLSDAGAYFTGTFLGKHKLCPNISPKKTVEGAVGGIIFGILSGIVAGMIFSSFIYGADKVYINYGGLALIGVLNSVIAILGDLCFSLIKRSCSIKDYGTIMPGHGGLLDRFDSVIFTAPLVYLFCRYAVLIAPAISI